MKRFLIQFTLVCALAVLAWTTPALALETDGPVRAGLYYGSAALDTANLENSVGSGYRFGYFDGSGSFVTLGSTGQTQITMLKTQNLYVKDGTYSASDPGGGQLIGCYHIQLPASYGSFAEAKGAADAYTGGFPAWISGTYYARVGAYATQEQAQSAMNSLGLSGGSVANTSSYGISVTETQSGTILFQFDSGGGEIFAVNPGQDDGQETVTWFKGYRYYGDFLYERIGGGSLTVVNRVMMDDYIKGILPYEMSASWPLEALKAQAVCARSYTMTIGSKHAQYHFDVCTSTDCQVYKGLNSANETTDRAVEETSGICAWYNGSIAQTFYYASNGGASENSENVWGTSLPYLRGVKDPYEAAVAASVNNYNWTYNYTKSELTAKLRDRGVDCGAIVSFRVTGFTEMGNVAGIAFTDSSGEVFSYTKERARTILGLPSMRFQVSGGGESGGGSGIYVGGGSLGDLSGVYVIDGSGEIKLMSGISSLQALSSTGVAALIPGVTGNADTFTITGSGNGHHVGMSQWGANAMAKQGYTYQDILTFYFTGIDLY